MDFAVDLDMGFIFVALLGILGAALIGGGIVAYRGSTAVMARSFSAASVVAGPIRRRAPVKEERKEGRNSRDEEVQG